MKLKWKKGSCPSAILAEIASKLSVRSDGSVSFTLGVDFDIDALLGRVEHQYDLDSDVLFDEFKSAIFSVAKGKKLSEPQSILQEFAKKCARAPSNMKKYMLVTSISLKTTHVPKRRKIENCVVSFSKSLPSKYRTSRAKLVEDQSALRLSEQDGFMWVTISVLAPDPRTAFKKGIEALDIIRAIWQVLVSKKTNFLAFSNAAEYPTDSVISLGQVHTLHGETGSTASEIVWYEMHYRERRLLNVTNFQQGEVRLAKCLMLLRKSPYSEHLSIALKGYINALDQIDHEARFLSLWSVLEKLVQADNISEIKKRVSFFFNKREMESETLESLKFARNVRTHACITPLKVELKCFRLCIYLDHLFQFYISNPFQVESLDQLHRYVSMPTNSQTIDQQIRMLRAVKKFVGV